VATKLIGAKLPQAKPNLANHQLGLQPSGRTLIMNVPLPGGGYEPRQFSTWAPLVLSGIGDLPDTVRDRSIQIDMVRKRKDEQVRRLRSSDGKELAVLARKAARWAHDNFAKLLEAQPQMPQALNDRAADVWEPFFAIAALACRRQRQDHFLGRGKEGGPAAAVLPCRRGQRFTIIDQYVPHGRSRKGAADASSRRSRAIANRGVNPTRSLARPPAAKDIKTAAEAGRPS
jgi:hypothetical protein